MSDPTRLPDLASRALGGAVLAANDESFAAKENLVLPHPAQALPGFGHRGKEYDGWETRRRRSPGSDWAIVRLGVPGVVGAVVVDTAHFTGNHPARASLEGASVEGHPTVAELERADWQPLLHTTVDLGPGAPAWLPPVAPRAYASTVHAGGDEQPVHTGDDAVRLPLPGGWTATAWGAELHRVTGALAALTAPGQETA